MRITKTHIATALKMLIDAGQYGVHSQKLCLTTQYKYPQRLINTLEKEGYLFKVTPMVKFGDKLGVVYRLLEEKPRKQLVVESYRDAEGRPYAKFVEVDNSPKQEGLFT